MIFFKRNLYAREKIILKVKCPRREINDYIKLALSVGVLNKNLSHFREINKNSAFERFIPAKLRLETFAVIYRY